MIADDAWRNQSQVFWNYVRVISENLGYSRSGKVLRHGEKDIRRALINLNLSTDINVTIGQLVQYFHFRADLIETTIATYLQTPNEARTLFEEVVARYTTSVTSRFNQNGHENARVYTVKNGVPAIAPYNKQKGHKREIDYLTAVSNILEAYSAAGEMGFGWWLVEHYFSYHVNRPDGCGLGEPTRGRKDPPYFQMGYGSFDHIADLVDTFVESPLPA